MRWIMLILFLWLSTSFALQRDPFDSPQSIILKERWIPLFYVKAKNILNFINSSKRLLSPNGFISVDANNNQLWIGDDADHVKHIQQILAHLDRPLEQFQINAKILMLDQRYEKQLGVQFNQTHKESTANNFLFNLATINNALLNLQLSALEKQGHATVISKPSILTLNHKTALIESGAEIPYQENALSGGTSVNFKKAVLRLMVTPTLLPQHRILLQLKLNQDKVSGLTVKGVPAIETQQIATEVIARNHQTILLGGILEENHSFQTTGLPWFSHIPIVGWLLQHHHKTQEKQMLIICITPKLIS